jgi:hypothetical protein
MCPTTLLLAPNPLLLTLTCSLLLYPPDPLLQFLSLIWYSAPSPLCAYCRMSTDCSPHPLHFSNVGLDCARGNESGGPLHLEASQQQAIHGTAWPLWDVYKGIRGINGTDESVSPQCPGSSTRGCTWRAKFGGCIDCCLASKIMPVCTYFRVFYW